MKVKVIWEFDVDTTDLDPKFVDIPGQAKDLTKRELQCCLDKNELCADDFEYVVEEE